MKLYATTTSERASKGQGGNDYIQVSITNEDEEIIAIISVWPDKTCRITTRSDIKVLEDSSAPDFIGKHHLFTHKTIKGDHKNCALDCSDCGGCVECGCKCKTKGEKKKGDSEPFFPKSLETEDTMRKYRA